MRLTRRLSGLRTFVPWALTTTTAISGYATAAEATAILDLINSAKPATTVTLPTGTYTAPVGTSLFINKPLTILGNNATLVNVRLNFASNISLSNLTLIEQDCVFHISDPNACSPATPMISIGGNNSVVNQAQLKQITLNFGRAYTGIAFGQGSVSNLVIDGFDITSNEMSAITALGGHNIRIANGVMRGGNWANVDDGVALYSIYDELRYVVVENIRAENIFDAVGIGAHLFKPLRDIEVRGVSCVETAVCIYFKAGDVAPPTGVRAYSQMSGISVDRVENLDPTGKRYLSTIWMYAKGGASAKDISVSNVYTSARASTSTCAHCECLLTRRSAQLMASACRMPPSRSRTPQPPGIFRRQSLTCRR
jgi:hypothetical protein